MDITDTIITIFIVGVFAASLVFLLQIASIFNYSVTTWGYSGTQSALSYKILSAPCISQLDSRGMPLKFNYDASILQQYDGGAKQIACVYIPSAAKLFYISGFTIPYNKDSATNQPKTYMVTSESLDSVKTQLAEKSEKAGTVQNFVEALAMLNPPSHVGSLLKNSILYPIVVTSYVFFEPPIGGKIG